MGSIGNMTNVEKELNKLDLCAYKKFDNNQYALIPGNNTQKAVYSPGQIPSKAKDLGSPINRNPGAAILNENKVRKHEDRLAAYGLLNLNRGPPNVRHGNQTKD